jgi:hypothetical protein
MDHLALRGLQRQLLLPSAKVIIGGSRADAAVQHMKNQASLRMILEATAGAAPSGPTGSTVSAYPALVRPCVINWSEHVDCAEVDLHK